jgi:hypothetical protein
LGINNKQRRAAKRRKNGRGSTQQGPQDRRAWDPVEDAFAVADRGVAFAVRVLSGRTSDDSDARRQAELLERRLAGERHVVELAAGLALTRLVEQVVDGGWGPGDLAELVSRRAHARHLPVLAAALHHDRRDHDRGVDWQTACERVGPEARLLLPSTAALASALRVAAVLTVAPRLAVPASQTVDVGGATHPKLAKVRALLAKAESTQFDEEAEALSAKAQELITRYALDQLLRGGASSGDVGQQVRRLWLDAPYTRAKANLVHVVAEANRCRAAFAQGCDFSVVVGAAHDIEAVELLVTSLLVQADAAMLRHSRQTSGHARIRSFRQSFLLAYAARIGERLRAATRDAVDARGDGRLLPALLDHDTKVEAAFDAMVPHRAATGPAATSADGWAAGTVAADLARLDANAKLTSAPADHG